MFVQKPLAISLPGSKCKVMEESAVKATEKTVAEKIKKSGPGLFIEN